MAYHAKTLATNDVKQSIQQLICVLQEMHAAAERVNIFYVELPTSVIKPCKEPRLCSQRRAQMSGGLASHAAPKVWPQLPECVQQLLRAFRVPTAGNVCCFVCGTLVGNLNVPNIAVW